MGNGTATNESFVLILFLSKSLGNKSELIIQNGKKFLFFALDFSSEQISQLDRLFSG